MVVIALIVVRERDRFKYSSLPHALSGGRSVDDGAEAVRGYQLLRV
jgi:hypothetical protein